MVDKAETIPGTVTFPIQAEDGSWINITAPDNFAAGRSREEVSTDWGQKGTKGKFFQDVRERIKMYKGHTMSMLPKVHLAKWLRLGWTPTPTAPPPPTPFVCARYKQDLLGVDKLCNKGFRYQVDLANHIRAYHESISIRDQEALISGYLGKPSREVELEDRIVRLEALLMGKVTPDTIQDPGDAEAKAFEDEIDAALDGAHTCKAKGKFGHYDSNCPRCSGLKAEKLAKSMAT